MSDTQIRKIKSILSFQIIFGLYHGYFISFYKRFVVKILCVGIAVTYSYMNTIGVSVFGATQSILRISEYVVCAFFSIYTEHNYLFEYFKFDELSDNLKQRRKWNRRIMKFLIAYIIIATTLITTYFTIIICSKTYSFWDFFIQPFAALTRLGIEIGYVPVILIFVLFYCRIKMFCSRLRLEIQSNETFDWKKNAKLYIYILKSLAKTDFPVKFLILFLVTLGFFDITLLEYSMLTSETSNRRSIAAVQAVFFNFMLFSPSILLEMASEELEKLQTFIADRVIICTDEKQKLECKTMSEFLKQNPLKYFLWRTLPVDARLPLGFVSLSVTCVVCLLQFTHVWDKPHMTNTTVHA